MARSCGLPLPLDSHDREVIGWVATTAGISGQMIRDMMVHRVEQRFGDIRASREVQWLTDNGSIFAAFSRSRLLQP
jgi:transposase InsO family protein